MEMLKTHLGHHYKADKTKAFQHADMISRCFYANSIEEIKENLKKETSPFAQECLEAMDRNSDLSMRLALKMLREAQNMDYINCLRMEVKVASSIIDTQTFDAGVEQVLLAPKAHRG